MGRYCELCMGENIGKPDNQCIEVQLETHRCAYCATRFCDRHWKETEECSCAAKIAEENMYELAKTKKQIQDKKEEEESIKLRKLADKITKTPKTVRMYLDID